MRECEERLIVGINVTMVTLTQICQVTTMHSIYIYSRTTKWDLLYDLICTCMYIYIYIIRGPIA